MVIGNYFYYSTFLFILQVFWAFFRSPSLILVVKAII